MRVCAYNVSGHGIGCQAVGTPYIYSNKHTSARKEIKLSPPNLSEGGSLRSPIRKYSSDLQLPISVELATYDNLGRYF